MSLLRYISLSLIFLMSALCAFGQVRIHGRVSDEKLDPIEFATVRIAGTAIGVTSGLDGDYTISAPKNDTIRIVFTCLGYKEVTRTLINPEDDITLNVGMMPNSKVLKEVELTEIKKQTSTIQTLDPSSLKLSPDATGGSVEAMISTLAGVNSNNEMSSQYSVRGGTYDENSVRINGVEIYRPQLVSSGQQEGLSVINPSMVDAIGFSTGGFSAEYGDKMSSALDITYREPESFEGSAAVSLMGASLSLGQSSKKFSQLYGFRYKRNTSLLGSMDTKGEYDPRFIDFQTNIVYKPSPKWRMSFLGNIAINDYRFKPADRTTNFGTSTDAKQFKVYFDGQERDKFETWMGAYSLTFAPSTKTNFTLLASGFLTNELVSYDISGEYWLDQAGTTGSGSSGAAIGGELGVGRYMEHARNRLKASVLQVALRGNTGIKGHSLLYGISLNSEKIMDRSREWEQRDSSGYSLPTAPDALKMIYNLSSHHDISSTRLAVFVQDTYKLQASSGFWSFNAGLRLSHWSFNRETLVSPRASVAFMPDRNPNWAFRFATGLYYQSPFYKEFRQPVTDENGNTTIKLNDQIKSPQSFQLIFGTDFTFRAMDRPFKLSAEAYYKNLHNLIPYEIDNLKVSYSGVNSSNGFTAGLDLKLFGQFVPGTDSWISFSVMKTQENLGGVKVPLPTDQRYSLSVYFTDYFPKVPRLKFSLRGIFADGLPATAPRSTRADSYFRTPAYKRLDIGLSFALVPELKAGETRHGWLRHIRSSWIGVDVFNLLDIANVNSYYWVTDVNRIQYAVPNYLTRRQINVRLSVDF